MTSVHIKNLGNPKLPPDQRKPWRLQGWIADPVPVGERLEITDEVLAFMVRPQGEESAKNFAIFHCGVVNGNREDWLVPEDEDGNDLRIEPAPVETPVETPKSKRSRRTT